MLNFLNEIQLLKNYWIYDNNNNDNVTIQTGQSIFQQFINYGQIILNLCQCNMKCFICEYIQLSTKSLLKEFTTIRLTVVEKLEQLYSNLQVHINQYGKFQTFFRSIIHQLKQSKDIYETNIKELLIDNHCICSSYPYGEIVENTNPNLVNPDFNHIPPSLSLMNLAKSACQHTLLSNIKEFSTKSIKESTFSLNKEIFNLIKLTDLYLCRIKHQRIQWINSIEYLQSIQLYSTGLLSFNENKLNLYISQTDYIINLMETIKRTNSINSLNLLPTKSIMSNIKLEYFNHFMKYFIEDNMINKKGMNNKDDCYNCVNSYLLQRFNLLEQNIIHSMKSLFVTTHEHSFKFKLDDIIKQCIHVNSWYNEYIQLEPLFIYVSTHIFTIKSFHQTICSRINNADILPNTILTSDWLILGIRLHQLKSVLHIIMNRWIHIVSLCNNVNALLDNAELSNVMSQIYPQKSGCSHIHRSLRSFNYQEAIDELKKQQILLNSLFLNEDTNCSHDVVNDLVGTFKNSSSPSSIVADEVNDGIIHNCHITNEIFLSSKSQVLCTICHRNPLIDNNIIDVSSINMLINEQVEHLKALNQYKVDDEKNTINFEQNQIYLTTLQCRIDMISEWIIHFIDETVLASSFNDELQENAEIFLDQLVKIEELLQNCLNEYETIIVYHVNDINIKIQLDLSILLINCLQVYINQLTQRIKHECEEILTYIKTNMKCLIEKMKMMLLVDVDDIMFIQYPYHEINQRYTSLNSLKSVYSTKSTNIQEIQFKLLYMTCIHNHLVNLCKVVNWASINAHSDTTVLLRQFCCSYTYLNRINKYIEYYNNTHQDESTDSIKLGSSLTLSALDPLQEGMRQKNCIKDIILENDIKPVLPSLFQAESDHSSTTTVRSFNNEIQSNVPDQIGLEKNCLKEKHASIISRKSSDLLINEPSSSTSPSLSSSALLLMDSKHKQLVSKSCTAKSPDYSIDNDNITSKIVIDGYKRSPVKHNPVHKLCSHPSSVVTRKFQSNSDVYDLLSQVKMSLTKVERHLYELDAYHHDDGDDDGRSFHHVNQVGESLSLTHLSTSCDQLKKFLGQLNAYGFRINFTNSSLKSTVPSSSTSVVTTDQDKLLNELNIVWRKLIVGTKKWISKLHYENNLSNLLDIDMVLTNLQLNNFIVSNLSSDELNNIHQTAKPYYINIILKNNDLSTVESTIQNVYNHHAKSLTKLFDLKQITNLQLYPDPVLHDDNEQSNVSNSLTESSNNKIRQIQLHFNLTSSIQRSITQIETTIISNFRNSSNYICIIQTFYQPNKINIKNTFKIVYKRNIHLNNELFINSSLNQISTTFNRNICEINYTNKHDDNNDVSDLDLDGDDDDHHHNSLRHSIYSMNTVFKNNYHYCKLFIQKRLLHNNLPFIHNNNHKLHLFPIYSSPSTSLSSSLPLLSSNVHYSHYQNKSILCRTTSYLSKRLFSSMFIKFLSYFLFLCIILYLIHFLIKSSFSLSDNLIIIHEDNCRQQKSSQIFFYSLLSWIQRISVNGVDESPKTVDIFNENPLTRIWPDKAPPF